MNNLVFNTVAKNLKAAFYGFYDNNYLPVTVDEYGYIIFSPLSVITVTATDLDIRNLNYAIDSVTITATDLDIRNLQGTTDSIQIASCAFVEESNTLTIPAATQTMMLIRDISAYSQNSFYIRNVSGGAVTVSVQVAPTNDNAYFTSLTATSVPVGSIFINAVTVPIKYARLSVTTNVATEVSAYYNGRA